MTFGDDPISLAEEQCDLARVRLEDSQRRLRGALEVLRSTVVEKGFESLGQYREWREQEWRELLTNTADRVTHATA